MQRAAMNTWIHKHKKEFLLLCCSIFLTIIYTALKFLSLCKYSGFYFLSWVSIISCLFSYFLLFRRIFSKNSIKILSCICLSFILIALQFVWIPAFRFRVFHDQYEKASIQIHENSMSLPNGTYLPYSISNEKNLGKAYYCKSDDYFLVIFEESYTLFDCFCYVRCFSSESIYKCLPDAVEIHDIQDNWYHINLF